MTPTELKDLFRSEVTDEATPYLWSDANVWAYMDQAQKEFVRGIGGLRDSTTAAVCEIDVTAGDIFSAYHASILKFHRAQRESDYREIDILDYNQIDGLISDDYGHGRSLYVLDDTEGRIVAGVIGLEEQQIRWINIPAEDETIKLTVDRLPVDEITAVTVAASVELEVRAEYQPLLLHWMKHRAYSKEDAETFDRGKAAEFLAYHIKAVADAQLAQNRRRHKSGLIAYGGL